MLQRIVLYMFVMLIPIPSFAHVHVTEAQGPEPKRVYDYTRSDAKDCCNNGDCRPALRVRKDATHYHFWVEPKPTEAANGYEARWVKVPIPEVRSNDLFGDRMSHWCGDLYGNGHYTTRCAFVPPKDEMTKINEEYLDATLRRPRRGRQLILFLL